MKESYFGYALTVIGVFALIVMMIIRDYQTTNDNDYYIMKEVLQDAMIDSVDYAYWREKRDLRIIEEKFAENYLRRFAQSMSSNKNYKIELYAISENPPKASVKITTSTGDYFVLQNEEGVNFGIINIMSGILDSKDYATGSVSTGKNSSTELVTDSNLYYSVGYIQDSVLTNAFDSSGTYSGSYSFSISSYPSGVTKSKIKTAKVSIRTINSIDEAQAFVDSVRGGIVTQTGGGGMGVADLTASTIVEHALTNSNMSFTATPSCGTYGCTVTVNYTIWNKGSSSTNVDRSAYYTNGTKAPNLWYLPFVVQMQYELK